MVFWVIVGVFLIGLLLFKVREDFVILALSKKIKTVNGADIETVAPIAEAKTIFGNNFDIIGLNNEEIFGVSRKLAAKYRKSYLQYIIGLPIYNVIKAKDAELIFNDMDFLSKGIMYSFLWQFLKTGLLTSTGKKWHSRRKMLTPAFHYNVLEKFLEIFKEECLKFQSILETKNGKVISLTDLIPRLTLNNVCETALGVKLDNMIDGDAYREHISDIEKLMIKRISNPLLMSDFLWEHFGEAKRFNLSCEGVHKFSSNIIEKRRAKLQEMDSPRDYSASVDGSDDIFFSKKVRYAMLDTLLKMEKEGFIDHQGICEEVDTFIFEGFDTTSMGLIYGIMNLSQFPEIQKRCFEEIESIIDDDLTKLTIAQINKLEYLDRFIKENLRMYPPVPLIMRETRHGTQLSNNLLLPKGTQIIIHIYDIHRDPEFFPDPDKFDPDRFLPENSERRHAFTYVPFSAGSRNCIGQKFAVLEMKTVLIYLLKNFEVIKVGNPHEHSYESGMMLRASRRIKVRIARRK